MRALFVLPVLLYACSSEDAGPGSDPAADRFTVTVPEFTIEPGDERFLCYHTTIPVEEARAIWRYQSRMTAGSHHLILFYVGEASRPDGTLEECQGPMGFAASSLPVWAYASQEQEGQLAFPEGVAVPIRERQPVVVNMHYYNIGEVPIPARVNLELEALPLGQDYQAARAFVTFNTEIEVPPGQTASFGGTCAVPAGARFVAMTTHSHQFTTAARVLDGQSLVLETTDWAHPTVGLWPDAPHLEFSSGTLEYRCDYDNPTGETLTVGESALTSEMCMAGGFFFPADADVFCLNSIVLDL